NGAGLTSTGPCPQFIVTSARISAVTSATAGFARRIASWTLSPTAARGSASHPVASRSPATTALMPSPTYHGRTAGTMARRFQLLALPAESLLVVLDRLGRLTLLEERGAPVAVGEGKVGIEAQRLLEVVDRRGRLAQLAERRAPVVLGDGEVGFEAQRLLEMVDRLGRPALTFERHAPVVVGEGKVGLGAQRLLEMVDRLGRPALTIEQLSEVAVSDGRVGVDREGVGPEPPRVVPDLDLVPGEDSQRDDD